MAWVSSPHVVFPLLKRSSTQATGFRVAKAFHAQCAPALRFTLAESRREGWAGYSSLHGGGARGTS